MKFLLFILAIMMGVWFMFNNSSNKVIEDYANIQHVKNQIAKLAPVEISADWRLLTENDRAVLRKLVAAAKLMDEIFLRQVYSRNVTIRNALKAENHPDYPVLLQYFSINFGPFDRLNHDQPFINLSHPKPAGANFYPEDMTREEFEHWLREHPEDEADFTSNYTIIRRKGNRLVAIPYAQAYREFLEPAAQLLKEAASIAQNPSLKKFLNSRAEAFLSNDYFQSDMDWMDLNNHTIEVVIGPYEVYEDALLGYKASFEAFITIVDPEESAKLQTVNRYLEDMERHLPIPDKYKNFNRGNSSPIVVVQEVFTGGDTKAGIQTTAFNLPNDERVREAKGSKKVMLKNVAHAKYQTCWIPIVNIVLDPKDLKRVSFDAYFNHVLMHEMSHGLGPGTIIVNGKTTTVNKALKETYATIEECKADILGVYNLVFLVEKGVFPEEMKWQAYSSYLGGIFRSVRFGINEAHGGANAIAFNYLMEKGGFEYDPHTQKFRVNDAKIATAIRTLARELLMIQARGDYEAAKAFIDRYRYLSPEMQAALDKLKNVPVDIRPIYTVEQWMAH